MAYRYEQNEGGQNEIVIDGFEQGIGKDPFSGLFDMRNMNINVLPGTAGLRNKPLNINPPAQNTTFTAAVTDICTVNTSLQFAFPTQTSAEGRVVTLTTTGTLPAGLALATNYYIISETSATEFKLASSFANFLSSTAVNITDTGTGVHTMTTVNMRQPVDYATYDNTIPYDIYFILDETGRVWVQIGNEPTNSSPGQWILLIGNTLSGTLTTSRIAVFEDWLFVFRSTSIDVYGPISLMTTAGTWYNAWKTIASNVIHTTFVGSDNTLYWGDASTAISNTGKGYIGSLTEGTSGAAIFSDTNNPTTSNSTTHYAYNAQALDLPAGFQPTAINELGINLMIGTNRNKIFPWDRVSSSFSFPLETPELFCQKLLNINNILYIFSGLSGVVYKTNGSQCVEAFRVPKHLWYGGASTQYQNVENVQWGAVNYFNNNIYFGCLNLNNQGVYKYDITNDTLIMDASLTNTTSAGQIATVILPIVSSSTLYNFRPMSFVDYQFVYSLNSTNTTDVGIYTFQPLFSSYGGFYDDYSSFLISDIIPVGTSFSQKTFQQIEFKLARPLAASEGVKLYYRLNTSDATTFTEIGEYLYDSANPSKLSAVFNANIEDAEYLQIKAAVKGKIASLNSLNGTNLAPLKEIRIR